jgi:hypothetical protein
MLNFLSAHGADILHALTELIAGASIVANLTHTKKDDAVLGKIDSIVSLLAANFFKFFPQQPSKLND